MPSPSPQASLVLDAMRSGEWLRGQWIARVVFEMGTRPWEPAKGAVIRRALVRLKARGQVERRLVSETRHSRIGETSVTYEIPRTEWRLRPR